MARNFKPSVRRMVVRRGGRIDSDKHSVFFDQVVDDIITLGENTTDLQNQILDQAADSKDQSRDLRQRTAQLQAELDAIRVAAAEANTNLVHYISMHDATKFQFLDDSSHATRVSVDTYFGEGTVPINAAESRLFQQTINTGTIIPIEDLGITVTGTFDADDGQGIVNHESEATITTGEPLRAFNGNNVSRWVRKATYPLYNDTTETMCEVTIDVPAGSGGESNVLYVVPAPLGDVDILGVYTSPDLSNSFSLVPGFSVVNGAGPRRWIFPVRTVQRIKIRFRQRNWVEEDGMKVFKYGAQEIGLQLLEWDKTYSSSNPLDQNHTVVLKQDAPDGYGFNSLKSLTTTPDHALEDAGLRHMHVKVTTDADGTDVIWDSDLDALPQDTSGFAPSSAATTLYFLVTLNYVATSGGATGPFLVGTTPVFNGLGFQATVEAV